MGMQKNTIEQGKRLKTQMRELAYTSNKQNHIQAEKKKKNKE